MNRILCFGIILILCFLVGCADAEVADGAALYDSSVLQVSNDGRCFLDAHGNVIPLSPRERDRYDWDRFNADHGPLVRLLTEDLYVYGQKTDGTWVSVSPPQGQRYVCAESYLPDLALQAELDVFGKDLYVCMADCVVSDGILCGTVLNVAESVGEIVSDVGTWYLYNAPHGDSRARLERLEFFDPEIAINPVLHKTVSHCHKPYDGESMTHTVTLREDGTVFDEDGCFPQAELWTDLCDIGIYEDAILIGVKTDGTVCYEADCRMFSEDLESVMTRYDLNQLDSLQNVKCYAFAVSDIPIFIMNDGTLDYAMPLDFKQWDGIIFPQYGYTDACSVEVVWDPQDPFAGGTPCYLLRCTDGKTVVWRNELNILRNWQQPFSEIETVYD